MASTSATLVKPAYITGDVGSGRASQRDVSSEVAKRCMFGNYNGLMRSSPSIKCAPLQTHSQKISTLQVNARGTVKFSPGDDESKGKPRFGTQFFRPKGDDDEDAGDALSRGASLMLSPSTFAGLQLFRRGRQADPDTVFVAGANGQTGARIVLELLHDGFRVRAGVPDLGEAQKLAEFAAMYGIINSQEAKRLNAVEFDFRNAELTAKAIGNAGKVVIAVGEDQLGSAGKVTPQDAALVVTAAALAKINNLVVVSQISSTTALQEGPGGFFAKIISFFQGASAKGSLTFADLVDRIVETDMNYTIIQAVESEGVPDTYAATANVVISPEGAASEGKVSKLQVASVVSSALSNVGAAENKVFELSASSEAPATPIVDLLSKIPGDGRRAALAEARARAAAEEEARIVAEEARIALETAAILEEEARKLAAEEARAAAAAEKARARADAVSASVSELTEDLKDVGKDVAPADKIRLPSFNFGGKAKARAPVAEAIQEEEQSENGNGANLGRFNLGGFASRLTSQMKADGEEGESSLPSFDLKGFASRIGTVRGGESEEPKPTRQPASKAKPERAPAAASAKAGKRKGGLFGQESVYVDSQDAGDF